MAEKVYAIGDHVRLISRLANEHGTYQISVEEMAFSRDAADGLVLSIRDIRTGQLVTEAKGDPEQYVFQILLDNTFSSKFASSRNVARTVERPTAAPGWARIRAWLRDSAAKGELLSLASPSIFTDSPLAKMLDGWKVLKVFSKDLVSLEEAKPAQEAAG